MLGCLSALNLKQTRYNIAPFQNIVIARYKGGEKMMKKLWHKVFGHPHVADFVCPDCGPIAGGQVGDPASERKGTRGADEGMWRR